jgi:PBSX family phage portal protein
MPKPFIKPVASTVTPKTQRGRVRVLTRSHAETDVSVMAKDDMGSKQLRDPFLTAYDADPNSLTTVLRPPYKMETLKMLPLRNAILLQCIHAMVTNCHSFGHTLVFTGEKGKELSAEAVAEKKRIENFLEFPNDHDSLGDMRVKWGTDYETLGNPYFEVGRNAEKNIEFFYHIPGEKMRLCKVDAEPVLVKMKLPRGDKTIEVTARRYFRRFVQLVRTDKVYFKEFGDPRPIDPKTGKVNQALKLEEQATEILHAPQYWSGSPYGVPCWVNNLPAILGMREADMVNLQYFEDNAIPAMAVLVSGGSLAEETLLELQEKFVNNRGRDQVNRVVVIEAVADMDAAGDTDSAPPVPHLSIQPLRDAQQSDALFLAYDEACMSKIRGSFRLPPIYVGRSDDYTRATAESSAQLAEIQVFAPRRNIFDDMMNTKLLVYNNEPPKFWRFKSNGSKLVDPALILQALAVLETLGAATPNLAIQIANDLFGLDIAPVVEEWGSKPFEFMKQELNLKAIKAGKPQLADGKQDPNAEEGGFPIAKSDLESLTRVTMAIGNFVEQRKKEDAEASARIAAKKKPAARLRE